MVTRNIGRWIVFAAVSSSFLAACVEQPPPRRTAPAPSAQQIDAVRRQVVLTTAPHPTTALPGGGTSFDGKVTLLGYDVQPAQARPGGSFTVTWYWHVESAVGDGWRLFTHLDDANGPRQNEDSNGSVRQGYQPERWRSGEFIRDQQTITIPPEWDSPTVKIHVGLWKDAERMRVTRGATSPDGRALVLTLPTGANTRVAELDVPHATGAITLDGVLNEPAWRNAGTTGPLTNPTNGAPPSPNDAHGLLRLLWDEQNLYLAWEVSDDNLVETANTGDGRDAHYWESDAVEALLDPDGNGHDYYEIQVSPGNHVFDTLQPQPPTATNFGNVGWNAHIQSHVVTNGTVGNEADTDVSYVVEMAIPFADINNGAPHTPPQAGDQWRANFFVMDKLKQGGQRFAAWSAPRAPSFHTPERFGRITFRPAVAMPMAPTAPPAAAVVPAMPVRPAPAH